MLYLYFYYNIYITIQIIQIIQINNLIGLHSMESSVKGQGQDIEQIKQEIFDLKIGKKIIGQQIDDLYTSLDKLGETHNNQMKKLTSDYQLRRDTINRYNELKDQKFQISQSLLLLELDNQPLDNTLVMQQDQLNKQIQDLSDLIDNDHSWILKESEEIQYALTFNDIYAQIDILKNKQKDISSQISGINFKRIELQGQINKIQHAQWIQEYNENHPDKIMFNE